jgi:DNA-binding Lrp family transcriptional regulator
VHAKYSCSSYYQSKLARARITPFSTSVNCSARTQDTRTPQYLKAAMFHSALMQTLYPKIVDTWTKCSRIVTERFGLEPIPEPTAVHHISASKAQRFGGYYDSLNRRLYLTSDCLEGRISLLGVVFREFLFTALPLEICQEARLDLSHEFAFQNLEKTEKIHWANEWRLLPVFRLRVNLSHHSYRLMNWIRSLGGEKELDLILHELLCMAKYGKSLSFIEYVEYMVQRAQNIELALTHAEIKILTEILNDENVRYKTIAQNIGFSESWVSTRINRLKQKYVLMELTATPFSKIGIRTFHVLLAGPSWSDPTPLVTDCPFLYNVQPILSGPWQVLARLAVPDNSKNIESLNKMASILNNNGYAVDVAETHSAGMSNSFYHYNMKSHKWEIPWIAMEGWGHRIREESLDDVVDCIDFPSKTTDAYLDSTDIQILGHIHDGITSIRALRTNLSIGQNKLVRRIKRLRDEDLIRRVWSVFNIGLVERVSLRATDKRTASILDVWARDLPRAYLHYAQKRTLLMITELPAGGSAKMMSVLRSLKWPVTISPLGSGVWGQWDFPSRHWSAEKQCWQSPQHEIDSWLNRLAIECEVPAQEQSIPRQKQDPYTRKTRSSH